MTTKVIRVESDCITILRKYAPEPASLTDAIREMERRIQDKPLPGQMSFTSATNMAAQSWYPSLEDGQTPEYWARMRRELDHVIKNYAGER